MAVIEIPQGLRVASQSFGLQRFDLEFGPGDSGAIQTAVLGPPRLTCSLVSPERMEPHDSALWRSLLMGLSGRVNKVGVYLLRTPQPLGTARGVWTVAEDVSAGAMQMTVDVAGDVDGKTLLLGDWIGVAQGSTNRQLVHVQRDTAIVDGQMVIEFRHALRNGLTAGDPVTWDKPTALFKQTVTANTWTTYPGPGAAGFQGGFSLDLMEAWE